MPQVEVTITIGEDNLITLDELTQASSGNYENSAAVTFTLKVDVSGVPGAAVSGADGISMPYVAASNGKYQGTLQDSVVLTETFYWLEITAAVGASAPKAFRRIYCRAKYHGKD